MKSTKPKQHMLHLIIDTEHQEVIQIHNNHMWEVTFARARQHNSISSLLAIEHAASSCPATRCPRIRAEQWMDSNAHGRRERRKWHYHANYYIFIESVLCTRIRNTLANVIEKRSRQWRNYVLSVLACVCECVCLRLAFESAFVDLFVLVIHFTANSFLISERIFERFFSTQKYNNFRYLVGFEVISTQSYLCKTRRKKSKLFLRSQWRTRYRHIRCMKIAKNRKMFVAS